MNCCSDTFRPQSFYQQHILMTATVGSILTGYKNTHGLCIALHVILFFVVHVLCFVLSSNKLTKDYWSMFPLVIEVMQTQLLLINFGTHVNVAILGGKSTSMRTGGKHCYYRFCCTAAKVWQYLEEEHILSTIRS